MSVTSRVPITNPDTIAKAVQAIRDRIFLVRAVRAQAESGMFGSLTVIAAHSRAFAEFLGLKAEFDKTAGKKQIVSCEEEYQQHENKQSHAIKLFDLTGQKFSRRAEVQTSPKSEVLITGFETINREILHLGWWETPASPQAVQLSDEDYKKDLFKRVFVFSDTVVELLEAEMKGIL